MIYDVLGVGFGPSNVALAVAMLENNFDGKAIFLDRKTGPGWQSEMLLDGSDIQNHPLRDFISPVNPRSHFSFTNYLHQSGKLLDFLNLGIIHPLRKDYCQYVCWVEEQIDNVKYNTEIEAITPLERDGEQLWQVISQNGDVYLARTVVMGTGRNLNIPDIPGLVRNDSVIHLTSYLSRIEQQSKDSKIAVLGASQSAVELLLDLMHRGFDNITSVHRSFSFRLKDTSPFSDEVYLPEFIDYYHNLSPQLRMKLDKQVRGTNYSSADKDVIEELYLKLYEAKIDGRKPVTLHRNTAINQVTLGGQNTLHLEDIYTGSQSQSDFDLLILATGFLDVGRNGKAGLPALLQPLSEHFQWQDEFLDVQRDYRVSYQSEQRHLPPMYLNGLCESSHGLGDAGSFSLISLRADEILTSINNNR